MALAGELAKYVGNEIIKTGGKSALSSLVPGAVAKEVAKSTAKNVAKNVGTSALNMLSTAVPKAVSSLPNAVIEYAPGGMSQNTYQYLLSAGKARESLYNELGQNISDADKALGGWWNWNKDGRTTNFSDIDRNLSKELIKKQGNKPVYRVEVRKNPQFGEKMNYNSRTGDNVSFTSDIRAIRNYLESLDDNNVYSAQLYKSMATPDNTVITPEVFGSSNSMLEYVLDTPDSLKPISTRYPAIEGNYGEMLDALERDMLEDLKNSGAEKYLGGRMLDKTGKPMTFYHSTPNDFTSFDNSRLGENTGYGNTALGHFVTTDKDFSKRFIDINNTGKTGRTMELQARVSNPITHPYMAGKKYADVDLDNIVKEYVLAVNGQEALDDLAQYAAEDGQSLYDAYMDSTFFDDFDPFEYAADDREALAKAGYDAVEIVEGLKNELVDGSNSSAPISSLAVLDGENLRPVRHIPVEKASSMASAVPVNTAGASFDPNDASSIFKVAAEHQKGLNSALESVASEMNRNYGESFIPITSKNKSVDSMNKKVGRKLAAGKEYTLMDMKDHMRGAIALPDYNNNSGEIAGTISALEKAIGRPLEVENVKTALGYNSLHLTWRGDDGLGYEVQLTTPEAWEVKKRSDELYDEVRDWTTDDYLADPAKKARYDEVERESIAMWNDLWKRLGFGPDGPDLRAFDNAIK